jgi:TPR repeat protein
MKVTRFLVTCLLFGVVVSAPAVERYAAAVQQAIDALSQGREEDFRKRIEPLVESGDEQAQLVYGQYLAEVGKRDEAFRLLQPLAFKGNAEAQYHLGRIYISRSVEIGKEGERWLSASAAQGHDKAILMLNNVGRAPQAKNGRTSLDNLTAFAISLTPQKVSAMPEDKLACYKRNRETLIDAYDRALKQCSAGLRGKVGESVPSEQQSTVLQQLSQCSNAKVFAEIGVAPAELGRCLGK